MVKDKNIEIDNETLEGLRKVQNANRGLVNSGEPSPNNVFIYLGDDVMFDNGVATAYSWNLDSNPTIYRITDYAHLAEKKHIEEIIADIVKKHIDDNGAIEELILYGHSISGFMETGQYKGTAVSSEEREAFDKFQKAKNASFSLVELFDSEKELKNINHQGQVLNKIVMLGCQFVNEADSDLIMDYRNYAINNNINISMTASSSLNGYKTVNVARFVEFNNEGEINLDKKLDDRYSPFSLFRNDNNFLKHMIGTDCESHYDVAKQYQEKIDFRKGKKEAFDKGLESHKNLPEYLKNANPRNWGERGKN